MASSSIVLHGTDLSQPCRTVSWLLRFHNTPFQYEHVMPGAKRQGTRSPEFQKKNKNQLVPVLEHGNVVLSESAAIIVYLAEALKWSDVYPLGADKDAVAKRAEINSWLHWAHRNSREFTIGLFAPLVRRDIKFTPDKLKELRAVCTKTAKLMDEQLAAGPFLCGSSVTLADFAVFADIGQCSKEDLDLFDFTPFPKLSAWVSRMKALPGYAETHEGLDGLRSLVEQAKEQAKKASAKL